MPPAVAEVEQISEALLWLQVQFAELCLGCIVQFPSECITLLCVERVGVFGCVPQGIAAARPRRRKIERVQVLLVAIKCTEDGLMQIVEGLVAQGGDAPPGALRALERNLEDDNAGWDALGHGVFPGTNEEAGSFHYQVTTPNG